MLNNMCYMMVNNGCGYEGAWPRSGKYLPTQQDPTASAKLNQRAGTARSLAAWLNYLTQPKLSSKLTIDHKLFIIYYRII